MALIAGKYQHQKNEDVEEYFTAVGVPYIGRKMMSMSSPIMEITLEGDTVTIKNSSLMKTTEYNFKFGEEYEEKMPSTSITSVTTKLSDTEMETKSVMPGDRTKCGRHYLFSEEGVVITLTHDNAKTPGKRYFSRIH